MESLMIKAALKKAGFTARQVSVKKGQGGGRENRSAFQER